jgi:hypothetical protein
MCHRLPDEMLVLKTSETTLVLPSIKPSLNGLDYRHCNTQHKHFLDVNHYFKMFEDILNTSNPLLHAEAHLSVPDVSQIYPIHRTATANSSDPDASMA